ncbi:GatB/YqeY domain-containing protein [Candidatus Absconditicoccus praedator]|uniref:GatB/YqeY domain-containing protein n=1 Tax=Candidatus Absconditicoccus praedator TaxID=2735562 RepID=UPI001E5B7268|nr:GatB/YqeY domain-containing protein [Candidatus Absconditicoccus praedator]UFX83208.1 GatB/YqeY domain-containing protein [Candidatus Absconditicoccus praedator]
MKSSIKEGYKKAMKEKDVSKKELYNYLLSQIAYKEKELGRELKDEEYVKIIQKEIKQKKEEIGFLKNEEDINQESAKLDLLESFLPEMIGEENLKNIVQNTIEKLGIQDVAKQKGQIIKNIFEHYDKTQIDGALLNKIIDEFK